MRKNDAVSIMLSESHCCQRSVWHLMDRLKKESQAGVKSSSFDEAMVQFHRMKSLKRMTRNGTLTFERWVCLTNFANDLMKDLRVILVVSGGIYHHLQVPVKVTEKPLISGDVFTLSFERPHVIKHDDGWTVKLLVCSSTGEYLLHTCIVQPELDIRVLSVRGKTLVGNEHKLDGTVPRWKPLTISV
jgi:hypothetical protein